MNSLQGCSDSFQQNQEAAVVDSEKDYATVKNLACNKVKSLLEQDVVMQ